MFFLCFERSFARLRRFLSIFGDFFDIFSGFLSPWVPAGPWDPARANGVHLVAQAHLAFHGPIRPIIRWLSMATPRSMA